MDTFRIRRATGKDTGLICRMMHQIEETMENPDYFCGDEDAFVERHVEREGFILLGEWEGEAAGFLMIRFPGQAEDNLLRDLQETAGAKDAASDFKGDGALTGMSGLFGREKLNAVAHFESAAVLPAYRGRGLQKQLTQAALKILQDMPYEYYFATVHPGNSASLACMRDNGFEVAAMARKYGGLERYILFRHRNP